MARLARYGGGAPPHLAVNVGDSFYQTGVRSTSDPRWNTTFEHAFTQPEDAYWYSVLGNHDWYGNEQGLDDAGTSAQVNYTQDNPYNRWCAPSLNYTFRSAVQPGGGSPGFSVDWVFIDTTSMLYAAAGGCRHPSDDGAVDRTAEFCRGQVVPVFGEQAAWLEEKTCGSDADWIVVVGHHPLASAGECMAKTVPGFTGEWIDANAHRYSPEVVELLRERFAYDESYTNHTLHRTLTDVLYRCGVNVYFAGHEHMTQFLRYQRPGSEHVLYQLGFGDNGNANLAAELRVEPGATACMASGQCFANESTVQAAYGEHWFVDFKDVGGAFGDVQFYKDRVVAHAVSGEGTVVHSHVCGPKAAAAAGGGGTLLFALPSACFLLLLIAACCCGWWRGRADYYRKGAANLDAYSFGSDTEAGGGAGRETEEEEECMMLVAG
ncbi:Purple acid phosphatase 17 [Diplonema papillatum]|nr:Purple acid phosphatase 17 [Diplonema papillatum]